MLTMPRMVARFTSWPRYRDHLAAMPEEVFRVDVGPIRHLLDTVSEECGSVQVWAEHREISGGFDRNDETQLLCEDFRLRYANTKQRSSDRSSRS